MYDMYYWDQPEPPGPAAADQGQAATGARPAGPHPAARPADPYPGPVQAVQVALDRRDNGGDSGAPRDQ